MRRALQIVRVLLAHEPELGLAPNYNPPDDLLAARKRYFEFAQIPPRPHFWSDDSWRFEHWEWNGPRRSDGQPYIHVNRRDLSVHQFLWLMDNGPIPEGLFAKPACGNRDCVSMHHVRLRPRRGQLLRHDEKTILDLFRQEHLGLSVKQIGDLFGVTERRVLEALEAQAGQFIHTENHELAG